MFVQVLKKLGLSGKDVCIQFVEVSEELSGKQQERLCGSITSDKGWYTAFDEAYVSVKGKYRWSLGVPEMTSCVYEKRSVQNNFCTTLE